jgi:hypothetical protein
MTRVNLRASARLPSAPVDREVIEDRAAQETPRGACARLPQPCTGRPRASARGLRLCLGSEFAGAPGRCCFCPYN